jgi:hypothetical protein
MTTRKAKAKAKATAKATATANTGVLRFAQDDGGGRLVAMGSSILWGCDL